MNLVDIVYKIKDSIDIIVNAKVEEKIKEYINSPHIESMENKFSHTENLCAYCTSLEELLRKEEASVRKHIAIEQSLKLNLERLIEKVEELEEEKNEALRRIVSINIFNFCYFFLFL